MVHAAFLDNALVVTSLLTMVADYDASRIQRDKYIRISKAHNAELRGQRAEELSRKSTRHADSVHPVQPPKTRSSPELRFPHTPQHHPYYNASQQRNHSLLQEPPLTYHNYRDRDYQDISPPNHSLYLPSGSRNDRRWRISKEGRYRLPFRGTTNRWPPNHIPWPSGPRRSGPQSTFPPWRSRPRTVPPLPPFDPRQSDHRSTLPSGPSRPKKVSPPFPARDSRQSSYRSTFPRWSPHPRTVLHPGNTNERPTDNSFITTPYPKEPTRITTRTTTFNPKKVKTSSIPPILIFTTQLPPKSSISNSTTKAATITSLQHNASNQPTSRRTKGITTTGAGDGVIGGKNSHPEPSRLTKYEAEYHNGKKLGLITVALLGVLLLLCIALVVVTCVVILRHRKNKSKCKSPSKSSTLQPRRMESAHLNANEFTHTGALKLDQRLKGPVKHSLEGMSEGSLRNVEFDPQLNEIVDIGTNVDIMSAATENEKTGGKSERESHVIKERNKIPVKTVPIGAYSKPADRGSNKSRWKRVQSNKLKVYNPKLK
ncbi:hypothetical protein GCK32_005062 [Trichostrongylus colubriformis]|uniref:Uncharacterized protein n=1 Tax=Trichostrongylus colubriformis TaxID=6319 RepID=A0AAN8G1T9_TRICO